MKRIAEMADASFINGLTADRIVCDQCGHDHGGLEEFKEAAAASPLGAWIRENADG